MMESQIKHKFNAFVGIDWGDRKHDFCLQTSDSEQQEFGKIEHTPEMIEQWARSIEKRFSGGPVAVCLEISKGPLVSALERYDFLVIFPVNPTTLAKYRQAFVLSHAKDDPSDAGLALDLLLKHPDRLQPVKPQSTAMRTLDSLVEERRCLVNDSKRITNRLVNTLKQYFPQVLDCFERRGTHIFCDFLTHWPSLKHAKRARRSTLEAFFHQHNVRRPLLVEQRIQALKAATPLTDDEAIIRPHQLFAEALVMQLSTILQAIDRFDAEIDAIAKTLPDYKLFSDLPGAGPALTPRLLVAFGEQRERFASAAQMQQYSGIAPVVERSGKKCWVHWRLACPTFLRQTFVEWSAQTITRSFWAGVYYHQQRDKGNSQQRALRALAFKWIRILYRCWKTRTPYDESVYLNALKKRGSPLIANLSESSLIT